VGESFVAAAGRPHLVTNAGDSSLTFLILKAWASTTTCRSFRASLGRATPVARSFVLQARRATGVARPSHDLPYSNATA